MKDYKKLLEQEVYKLDLQEFKNIPFPEFENSENCMGWLCYYEKNDIIKYCLEHPKYYKIIKDKMLLNDYCLSISLERQNSQLIDYLLEKKLISKQNIFNNIDGFLMGNNDIKYLPLMSKEKVMILGNKSIYHVKDEILEFALKNGFSNYMVDLESFLFCIQNHVNIENKEKVLAILSENLDISELISKNITVIDNNQQVFLKENQCMEKVIEIIFKNVNLKELCQKKIGIILKVINVEDYIKSDNFKNKILLEYANDFHQENLQKIKKYNKHFYRQLEKMNLYQDLKNSEIKNISKYSVRKI